MEINEADIKQIVERVIEKVAKQKKPEIKPLGSDCENEYGLFKTVEEAVKSAEKAFLELHRIPLEKRDNIIAAMRDISRNNIESLAEDMEKETGLGRAEDKKLKLKLAIEKTPGTEDIKPVVYSGDNGLTLIERAPYGVIGSITPVTNPVETIINNSIGFVASGNSAVFNAHPGSKRVSAKIIGLLNKAIQTAGGPANLLCGVLEPEIESAKELMQNDSIRLLVVTGGEGVVKEAMKSGKKVIAAGPGNPPVVVDETADIPKAAQFIMEGASTDNNIICVQEKEIIAVDAVVDELKEELIKNNGYEIKGYNIKKLEKLVVEGNGPNKKFVGKNASVILKGIGINVSDDIRLIIAEVDEMHPFVQNEMLMPVIGLVRMGNVDEAIGMAVRCEHGYRHTAVMHSKNIDNLSKMAKVMDTSIFVKNASSLTGLGHNGEGHTSYTIAGFTGEGLTSAKSFTRERRCVLKDHFRII
ncbi:aldehyde dehydrogenase family protein [candidate division KSB1 bacterium]